MSPAEFTSWLRGFLDRSGALTEADVTKIRDAIAKVKTAPTLDADLAKLLKAPYSVPFQTTPIFPTQPSIPDPHWQGVWPDTRIWCGDATLIPQATQAVGPEWTVPVTFTTPQES